MMTDRFNPDTLKPCPFCGGTDVGDNRDRMDDIPATRIVCYKDGCNAQGPWRGNIAHTRKHQIDAWNKRSDLVPRQAVTGDAWQTIETAPKDGTVFLICLPRMGNLIVRSRYNTIHKYFISDYDNEEAISRPHFYHEGDLWHPMPPLPNEAAPVAHPRPAVSEVAKKDALSYFNALHNDWPINKQSHMNEHKEKYAATIRKLLEGK